LLTKEHTAIQMRVLKSFFLRISGTVKDLSQIHLALMQEVLQKQAGPYDLPYGLSIRNYQGRILLEKKDITSSDNESDDWEIQLNIPGTTVLPSGLGSIEAVKIEYDRDFRYNSEMNCFSQGLPAGCVVRLRRPGDHIKPAGRQGTRTLKKFMNEEKIDPKLRNHLPVIANGSDIVWLPEHACGDAYICKIDDIDHSAIRLIWQR
ncbi:MAG: tRNA lysidine(34) synthetase TilS, partial [Clostridiaceae bacterium]|nr:tRNA lysidine(34) synthetase TilS [Clostridiaceae bacterium]